MTRTWSSQALTLVGADELKKALKELPEKTALKIQRKAMRESTKALLDTVKARTPVKSGALAASLKTRVRKLRGGIQGQVIAGDDVAWYAHLIEYGFWLTSHAGKQIRYIPGQKFLRGSIETEAQNILDSFVASVKEAVEGQ